MDSQLGDPFALLGLPRRFAVDESSLRAAHRRRVAAAHPDRLAGTGGAPEAVRLTSLLNEALRVLADPVARAEALLRLAGESPSGEPVKPMAPDFLMAMMELREAADEARIGGDRERIASLLAEAERSRGELLRWLESDFAAIDERDDALRRAGLERIRARLAELRYVDRLRASLSGADVRH